MLASTQPGQPLGTLDLSSIGGTNFAASGAPKAYSYSVVGYGSSVAGVSAYESYNKDAASPWSGIYGSLVNVGSSGTEYAFNPTDTK